MTVLARVQPSAADSHADSQARRRDRLAARYALWQLSDLRRVRACGRFVTDNDHGVQVRVSGSLSSGDRLAGLGGVQSCGSVWSCPVCSAKIQAERQAQVAAALAVARQRGWEVLFLTFTMRHRRDHRLKMLWEHLSTAWRKTTSGAGPTWRAERDAYGIAGYLRLVEVTHGANGWHLHVHTLLFLDPSTTLRDRYTDAECDSLAGSMFDRWRRALDVGKGIRPAKTHGVDWKRVRSDDSIAEYFAKGVYSRKGESSTAHDVTGSHAKTAKHGNRTPFGILASLVDDQTGEVSADFDRDLALWNAYEAASKGRRQLLWSRGLRDDLALGEDKTDEEIAEEEHGGESVAWIDGDTYKHIAKRRMIADLLEMAEADDTGALVREWLSRLGAPPGP